MYHNVKTNTADLTLDNKEDTEIATNDYQITEYLETLVHVHINMPMAILGSNLWGGKVG